MHFRYPRNNPKSFTYLSRVGSLIRSITNPRTLRVINIKFQADKDIKLLYREEVKSPRCNDRKVDQRSKPIANHDEGNGDSGLKKSGIQWCLTS